MRGLVNPGGAAGSTPKADADHVNRLKDVVRTVAGLDPEAPVLVQQLACVEPGCPPVETVIAALGPPRRTWKLSKPTADISPTQLQAVIVGNPKGITHADHD